MNGPTVEKWVTAIVGSLFMFFFVMLISSFLLRNIAAPPLDTVVGFYLPILIGVLAGAHSFRASLRKTGRERRRSHADPERPSRYPTGHCQKCGYNLKGNTTGTCPECGQEVRR